MEGPAEFIVRVDGRSVCRFPFRGPETPRAVSESYLPVTQPCLIDHDIPDQS